jgi:NAD(P)H-flavin reductase
LTPEQTFYECKLVKKDRLTHDTFLFEFQLPQHTMLRLRPCEHIQMRSLTSDGNDKKAVVKRYYTPVPESFAALDQHRLTTDRINLAIKLYETGAMSNVLQSLSVETGVIEVSGPIALAVDVQQILSSRSYFYLLAAGTGITPILNVIHELFNDSIQSKRPVTVKLAYFNKTETDIIYGTELDSLARSTQATADRDQSEFRFELLNVLQNPCESSDRQSGKVSKQFLQDWFGVISLHLSESFVFVCGPNGFVVSTIK